VDNPHQDSRNALIAIHWLSQKRSHWFWLPTPLKDLKRIFSIFG